MPLEENHELKFEILPGNEYSYPDESSFMLQNLLFLKQALLFYVHIAIVIEVHSHNTPMYLKLR